MRIGRNTSLFARLDRIYGTYLSPAKVFTPEDRKFRLNWWQYLCIIACSFVVTALLDYCGKFEIGRPVLGILGATFIALRLRWHLHIYVWFWAILVGFLGLATFLVWPFNWDSDGPSRGIIGGVMVVSLYFLFVALHVMERRAKRRIREGTK